MLPVPRADLKPNTEAFETTPLVAPTGFREYDARWLFPSQINLRGVQALGLGLGTLIHEMGIEPKISVGHDFRGYSGSIQQALMNGLMGAGCEVFDIGLALSPVAYFSQFALDVPAVAMVTASHNENGWTGVKMGVERPLTFGPDEMSRLKQIVLEGAYQTRSGGAYHFIEDMREHYIEDLTNRSKLKRKLDSGHLCTARARGRRRGSHRARLRTRSHLPALQPQPGRHGHAPCAARQGAGNGRRCRPCL
jgi:phosphomannomutase/phosphoglucomutase